MSDLTSPEVVVQRQLDAYNARDIDALMATYAEDAEQFEFPMKLLVSGAKAIRERSMVRFQEVNLHAKLLDRMVMDSVVIDHETVTRMFPEGPGTLQLIAMYEVVDGKIAKATFIFGEKSVDV